MWRGISGLCHARRAEAGPGKHADVKGEDPLDLREQIQRIESLNGEFS